MNSAQESISLNVSSASVQLGEKAVRLELGLQLYTQKVFNFNQVQSLLILLNYVVFKEVRSQL